MLEEKILKLQPFKETMTFLVYRCENCRWEMPEISKICICGSYTFFSYCKSNNKLLLSEVCTSGFFFKLPMSLVAVYF